MLSTREGLFTLGRLRGELDRLLSDFLQPGSRPTGWNGARGEFPLLNVWEDQQDFRVEAELPGYALGDVEIQVVKNELLIKGARQLPDQEVTYHRQERPVGAFSRTLQFPVDIDADKVEASLTGGILALRLPKVAEARPRKIQVNAR